MLVGAGILWIGWNGFNGGDPYNAGADASAAVINTNVATAVSLLVWTILDILLGPDKKPSVIGAVQGMITGLVAITPAAGVVAGKFQALNLTATPKTQHLLTTRD